MELYGLVSIIDDQVFGDPDVFREMYVNVNDAEFRNRNLRIRLKNFCKRTLRRQVQEYVPYTNRIAILQNYTPSREEEELYNSVSDYLRREKLYAFPQGQRQLLMLVVRKLLASSSMAIHGTLSTIIERLKLKLKKYEAQLYPSDFDDYDGIAELIDEEENEENFCRAKETMEADYEGVRKEIEELMRYAELAERIHTNAKGDNLLLALEKGFERNLEVGGAKKAVIFTESKRTQKYLFNLLFQNGYDGQIVFLDGGNSDPISLFVYKEWKNRHKDSSAVSGSLTADKKAAIIEEFRDRASILIATEAAAEGINLQFCNIVVNYDLPWNPQRIEQRIGRCHRYGQRSDVIVINFLNSSNAADQRVYDLLNHKFRLFEGVFGSSDEVLGAIEDGVDFEKRILQIYQTCRIKEDIEAAFNALQSELSDQINERMTEARQSILENFDEDVSKRLKGCHDDTKAGLDKFSRWLWDFVMMRGAKRIEPSSQWRFVYNESGKEKKIYNLRWKDAEAQQDVFLRRDDQLCQKWLNEAMNESVPAVAIQFEHAYLPLKDHISFLDVHPDLKGIISIDKLVHKGISNEEHLIVSVAAECGTSVDNETFDRMMELRAKVIGECPPETSELISARQFSIQQKKDEIAERNKQYFLDQVEKLDAYSEDLNLHGLEKDRNRWSSRAFCCTMHQKITAMLNLTICSSTATTCLR